MGSVARLNDRIPRLKSSEVSQGCFNTQSRVEVEHHRQVRLNTSVVNMVFRERVLGLFLFRYF